MKHTLTEPLRRHHDEFRPGLAHIAEAATRVPELSDEGRRRELTEVLEFLRGRLRLHAEAEELWLYPRVAMRLRHPRATAVMEFDHVLLHEYVEALQSADVADTIALQRLLFGVHALLEAHFRKEEEVYLPLLEYDDEAPELETVERGMAEHEAGLDSVARAHTVDPDPEARDFPADGLPIEKLAYLLRYAVQPPSSHNSQPWLFRPAGDTLELRADRSRTLPVVDSRGRELILSCAAALYHLRTAIRHYGYEPAVELLPEPDDPDLVARVGLGPARPPRRDEKLRFWAIPARHTNRQPFEPRPLPDELLARLVGIASAEGAWLAVVTDPGERRALAELVAEGDVRQFHDRRFRRELGSWLHRGTRARDGIPTRALDVPRPLSPLAPLAVRVLNLGRSAAARDRELAEHAPVLAVVGTTGDDARDWIQAGLALDAVLLEAARDEVSASFLNQPVEVDELRPRITDLLGREGYAQAIVRLGYGPAVTASPRRSPRDVLVLNAPER